MGIQIMSMQLLSSQTLRRNTWSLSLMILLARYGLLKMVISSKAFHSHHLVKFLSISFINFQNINPIQSQRIVCTFQYIWADKILRSGEIWSDENFQHHQLLSNYIFEPQLYSARSGFGCRLVSNWSQSYCYIFGRQSLTLELGSFEVDLFQVLKEYPLKVILFSSPVEISTVAGEIVQKTRFHPTLENYLAILGSPGPVASVWRSLGPALITEPLLVRYVFISIVLLLLCWVFFFLGCNWSLLALRFTITGCGERPVRPLLEAVAQMKMPFNFIVNESIKWNLLCTKIIPLNCFALL